MVFSVWDAATVNKPYMQLVLNVCLQIRPRLSRAYSMDVLSVKDWWPFHRIETTTDQALRDFVALVISVQSGERQRLLDAYRYDHASLLEFSPVDTHMTTNYIAHSLDDMLKGQVANLESCKSVNFSNVNCFMLSVRYKTHCSSAKDQTDLYFHSKALRVSHKQNLNTFRKWQLLPIPKYNNHFVYSYSYLCNLSAEHVKYDFIGNLCVLPFDNKSSNGINNTWKCPE